MVEVLNPDTGGCELYDPTWNVHFIDRRTGDIRNCFN
jgi:hypothetical protein